MNMPGRSVTSNRTLLIIIGVLAIAVITLTVILVIGHSGGSGQPTPVETSTGTTPVTQHSGTLPSITFDKTLTVSSVPTQVGSDPSMSTIGAGATDPTGFAQRVATSLLAYDWQTDFQARNEDLMLLAAPDPYGERAGLEQDITKMTPIGAALSAIQRKGSAVELGSVQVQESAWARQRMTANGAPAGAHGMDVSGIQTFKEAGQAPTSAPVTISMVVVCPPTTTVCTLTRIYPGTLQEALGG